MITTQDVMRLKEVCSGCSNLLEARGSDYPVCKIGKFREMDLPNRACAHKKQG